MNDSFGTVFDDALQHGPRPLPLFLAMLRSETATSPAAMAAALAGLRVYQAAQRDVASQPMPVAAQEGRVMLRDYGGAGRPVVFVPSLINPPNILDLDAGSSLVRWMAAQGQRVMLVDWGNAGPDERDLDLDDHVARILVPLIQTLDEPPVLVGYCLGGTLALAAAALTPVAGVATIAAPWRFAGYADARADIARSWAIAAPMCEALGVLPMEVLQAGFWQLDPARTIAKYAAFGAMDPDSEAARGFVRLEDWANGGAPLPLAFARALFEDCIAADLPGNGIWTIDGTTIDPLALSCPTVEFVSLTDRIVPAATAIGLPDRRDLQAGHVGMVIGGRARTQLWGPLADWIARLPAPT